MITINIKKKGPVIVIDGQEVSYAKGIRKIRKDWGFTADQFGEKLGITGRAVESWEYGERTPNRPVLLLLKTLLDSAAQS